MIARAGERVMVDYNTLQKRPDGRRGIGGVLCLYGIKRLDCIVVSATPDRVVLSPKGTVYTISVPQSACMKYDKNNNSLGGVGNSMYDNEPFDLS